MYLIISWSRGHSRSEDLIVLEKEKQEKEEGEEDKHT